MAEASLSVSLAVNDSSVILVSQKSRTRKGTL
jgi:hypothetical protein